MSVGLFRFEGNIYSPESEIDMSENVSSENFYIKHWRRAVKELNIKLFQDDSEFNKSQLDDVLKELNLLKDWAVKNLSGIEREYMEERLIHLIEVIPDMMPNDDTILYIF